MVTTLVLNENQIGHQGCSNIADALVKNHSLMAIELDDNKIGDAGCSELAKALAKNNVLSKLLLHGNDIGLAGATSLAEALSTVMLLAPPWTGPQQCWRYDNCPASILNNPIVLG
jgi:NLR family CARD domain-containing protein 3